MKKSTIDVHTHMISESYLAALADRAIISEQIGFSMPVWNVEQRFAEMMSTVCKRRFSQSCLRVYGFGAVKKRHRWRGP